ncbi:hypothetical protein GW916_07790 [bacterium]|nr:hypothetical protein [bacterium]
MKNLQLLLALTFSQMATGEMDLSPIYASDQPTLTSKSIEMESEQFRALGHLRMFKAKLTGAVERRDQAQKDLQRAEDLAKTGQISPAELESAKMHALDTEVQLGRCKAQVKQSESQFLTKKFKILEEGNPGQDHRKSIAEALLNSILVEQTHQKEAYEASKSTTAYFARRVESGKVLLEKKVISKTAYESRVSQHSLALEEELSIKEDLESLKNSIHGLKKTLERL